jgi:hypothetical protein
MPRIAKICPVCPQAPGDRDKSPIVGFFRCGDGKLVLRCFNCDRLWLDPRNVTAESALTAQPFKFLVPGLGSPLGGKNAGWAVLAEVEAAGWLSCADLDYAESVRTLLTNTSLVHDCSYSPVDVMPVRFRRLPDGRIFLACIECEDGWTEPEQVSSPSLFPNYEVPGDVVLRRGSDSPSRTKRWAIRKEIEAAGWASYLVETEDHLPRIERPKVLSKTSCPVCRDHSCAGFWRCSDGSVALRCFGCDWLWFDPKSVTVGAAVDVNGPGFEIPGRNCAAKGGSCGWASRQESEAAGWAGHVKDDAR